MNSNGSKVRDRVAAILPVATTQYHIGCSLLVAAIIIALGISCGLGDVADAVREWRP